MQMTKARFRNNNGRKKVVKTNGLYILYRPNGVSLRWLTPDDFTHQHLLINVDLCVCGGYLKGGAHPASTSKQERIGIRQAIAIDYKVASASNTLYSVAKTEIPGEPCMFKTKRKKTYLWPMSIFFHAVVTQKGTTQYCKI